MPVEPADVLWTFPVPEGSPGLEPPAIADGGGAWWEASPAEWSRQIAMRSLESARPPRLRVFTGARTGSFLGDLDPAIVARHVADLRLWFWGARVYFVLEGTLRVRARTAGGTSAELAGLRRLLRALHDAGVHDVVTSDFHATLRWSATWPGDSSAAAVSVGDLVHMAERADTERTGLYEAPTRIALTTASLPRDPGGSAGRFSELMGLESDASRGRPVVVVPYSSRTAEALEERVEEILSKTRRGRPAVLYIGRKPVPDGSDPARVGRADFVQARHELELAFVASRMHWGGRRAPHPGDEVAEDQPYTLFASMFNPEESYRALRDVTPLIKPAGRMRSLIHPALSADHLPSFVRLAEAGRHRRSALILGGHGDREQGLRCADGVHVRFEDVCQSIRRANIRGVAVAVIAACESEGAAATLSRDGLAEVALGFEGRPKDPTCWSLMDAMLRDVGDDGVDPLHAVGHALQALGSMRDCLDAGLVVYYQGRKAVLQ